MDKKDEAQAKWKTRLVEGAFRIGNSTSSSGRSKAPKRSFRRVGNGGVSGGNQAWPESPHYRELLHTLNVFEVEYLIVGGYAVMKYTEPRYTKDLDVWVGNSPRNSVRLYDALAKFGAPLKHDGVTPETFTKDKIVYQIGVAPVRIDISTHIDGVTFDTAWKNRVATASSECLSISFR